MKRLSFALLFLSLLWAAGPAGAQDNDWPLITDENITEVSLYVDLGPADEILAQPNSTNILLEDQEKLSAGKYGAQITVWDVRTRAVVATLETELGVVSSDGNYMMRWEDTGFSVWDLRAYKLLYRYSDPAFVEAFEGYNRYLNNHPRYLFFHVTETHAYVGGFWRLHVIDLATGQEIDRTMQWCQMPAEIAEVVRACADGTEEFSMMASDALWPQTMEHGGHHEYPESNLVLDARREGGWYKIYVISLNDGTERLWPLYDFVNDMQLIFDGHALLSKHIGRFEVYTIYDCRVQAQRDVNLRKGPGQTAQLLGTYGSLHNNDEFFGVIAQSEQPDGVWWQLSSGEWLRSDFAEAHGECDSLPTYVPAKNPT